MDCYLRDFTLSDWKDLATIAGVVIGVVALIKGVFEYIKQGSQKRAEQFFEMEKRFNENALFREIAVLTENDDSKLLDIEQKISMSISDFLNRLTYLLIQSCCAQK